MNHHNCEKLSKSATKKIKVSLHGVHHPNTFIVEFKQEFLY